MKVLVLHSELGVLRGGGENFTRSLFAAFGQLGHDVKAAFVADPRGRYPIPLPQNVEPLPLPGWWSNNLGQATLSAVGRRLSPFEGLKSKWDYFQNALDWRTFQWHNRRFKRRVIHDLQSDLRESNFVYVHSDPFLASEVARSRPTVLRLPGPVGSSLLPLLRSIHAVCANGDALTRVRSFMGDTVLELQVGVEDHLFTPGSTSVRASLGWDADTLVVGYTGRFTRLKGVDLLADAFRDLARKRSDVRLLMVGSGSEERHVQRVLEREIAGGLVHIEHDVSHERLADWYRAMDLLVMPSRYENWSNTVLEAMSCGIPYLASNIGGNRVLAESGAAWLFEPNSAVSLAAELASALEHREVLQARGQKGRAYISGRYSWKSAARRLEEIFAGLPHNN